MKLSRRSLFALGGGVLAFSRLFGLETTKFKKLLKISFVKETTSICCFCGVGCGLVVSTSNGRAVNIEGDPDHPVNEGALCSKGNALYQVANNERRLDKVLYRAPRSTKWEEKTWDWALDRIASRVKQTRDATFNEKDGAWTVNRTEGIACLGGAALDNEECYLLSKAMRSLGLVYLEHQARI